MSNKCKISFEKFDLDHKGLQELMKSPEMQSALDAAGEHVANVAGQIDGEEYAASGKTGRLIGFSNVYPNSAKAAHKNYENNTLIKALNASGLSLSK